MRLLARVEQSLKYNPELRNSDKKLLIHEWRKDGLELTPYQERIFLEKCKTAESITRARRLLKSQYPANNEVTETRYRLFEQYRAGDYR